LPLLATAGKLGYNGTIPSEIGTYRMRLLFIFSLFLALIGLPALAQDDTSVFEVTDVSVDVTAASAAKARDQAVIEAQRTAFHEMLDRIGARDDFGKSFTDDDIAALVQSFEVQNEHTSSVRYIGTFTVQFKPNAMRSQLSSAGVNYVETRGKLAVILPIYKNAGVPVLWEDHTKWRAAWEKSSPMNGLVPIVLPVGDPDDAGVLSAKDAAAGNQAQIKMMIDRYQAGEAIVTTLVTNLEKPGSHLVIDVTRYNNDGEATSPQEVSVPLGEGKDALDAALAAAVRKVRDIADAGWREDMGGSSSHDDSSTPTADTSTPEGMQAAAPEAVARLPVSVPIRTLADWAGIKQRLDSVPVIAHTDVITLARGLTSIEIEFHGDVPKLQEALKQQNLRLVQDISSNAWVLQATGGPM
jgi:Uncharacterized protein conserved in bacteria (DUF2066)